MNQTLEFLVRHGAAVLFATTLLLLFVGIHNAWDAVTYHVFVNGGDSGAERHRTGSQPKQ